MTVGVDISLPVSVLTFHLLSCAKAKGLRVQQSLLG